MSSCSINTETQSESLVAAIRDVLDARDSDLDENYVNRTVGDKFFRFRYPRLSDALDHAQQLVEEIK